MSNKLMFLLVTILLIVTIGLAGGFFMIWSKLSSLNTERDADGGTDAGQIQAATLGPLFSLDTFIVNLADEKRNRYLRVTMDLELTEATAAEEITKRMPQVRDSILMILPSKRFDDISTVEGKTALRDEIIAKLNSLYRKDIVSNIYFTEFVVQ